MAGHTVQLIDRRDVTVALLKDPLGWRVRIVEEITVDSSTSCLRRRSLQAAPLRQLLPAPMPRRATHALLALNIAPLPRGPLMDFDVEGPDGDGWLLPRTEIAARESLYLRDLAIEAGETVSAPLTTLMTSLLGFTGELIENPAALDLRSYLEDGVGRTIDRSEVQRWRTLAGRSHDVLRPRLDEFHGYSAPETPALVLPQLFDQGVLESDMDATRMLEEYTELLMRLEQKASYSNDPTPADEFLNALADYGNNYDLIVAMKVPLDEPFLVKFSERRDLRLDIFNSGQQNLVIADALSNHVTFKVTDPNIRIADFEAHHPASGTPAYGAFQSRRDQQSRSFYAHDADRDYRIQLRFRLGLLRRLDLAPYTVIVLLTLLTLALWISRPTQLSSLALVVGPSALAASVLLYREPTTLGSRLRFWTSLGLAVGLCALLATAAFMYVSGPNVLDIR